MFFIGLIIFVFILMNLGQSGYWTLLALYIVIIVSLCIVTFIFLQKDFFSIIIIMMNIFYNNIYIYK